MKYVFKAAKLGWEKEVIWFDSDTYIDIVGEDTLRNRSHGFRLGTYHLSLLL